MKLAHVAPFAPNRCGLYEAARDMARADIAGGHTVYFVDAGVTFKGKLEPQKVGAVDDRAGFKLVTAKNELLNSADIIIMHTGLNDSLLVKNQAPLIWAVHGRPLACFRPERLKESQSYSLYRNVSHWPRSKAMLYFWPEFKSHWEGVFPNNKHVVLDYPVIDETRFNNTKEKHKFVNPGQYNILICDSERKDIDLYELTVGLIKAAEKYQGIKFHFYGLDMPEGKLPNCWNILLTRLKNLNAMGDVSGRVANMEKLYNASDCLISPNRIITRTIGESLSCGCPVIAQNNRYTKGMIDITCDMSDPDDIVEAIGIFKTNKDQQNFSKDKIIARSKVFSLEKYYTKMNEVYKSII